MTGFGNKMKTKESGKGKTPMDAALHYLSARARTVAEMELHLDKCQYGEFETAQVVERLKELRYLDDDAYAREFVRTRLATKPISRRKLREQLMTHKLPKEAIDAALGEVTDETEAENAAAVCEKFLRQFASLPEEERKQRVMRRLFSHGYAYEAARAAMAAAGTEVEETEYASAGTQTEEDEL